MAEILERCLLLLLLMFTYASGDDVGTSPPGPTTVFCVANGNADPQVLKDGLDWACGPGSANCSAIQPGQPCYVPDNIPSLASYAYNDYYHRAQHLGGTCDFNNTATTTSMDPSHGSCIFAGSTNQGSGVSPNPDGMNFGAPSPNNSSSAQRVLYLVPVILLFCLHIGTWLTIDLS